MDHIVHWIGLESIDIPNRILWMDQVSLICMMDNGNHTCMYMYIVLTVFPDEVIRYVFVELQSLNPPGFASKK